VLPFSPLEDAYRLLCGIAERGRNAHGGERTERTSDVPVRLAAAREPVIVRSRGRCESPKSQATSMTKRHPVNRSLDIDHVHDLGNGGVDLPASMIALCPNCHATKTRGTTRDELTPILLAAARARHNRLADPA
jgi:5-methylcytosine-specific restriction enzyme A